MSRKTERLVNLTIALLATKRYLTKSEIFRSVDGYEGSAETKERMFERDKDDLRGLGIEIEVGSFDPLFEDEPGYRIQPERYQFQLSGLDATDVAVLSLAAQAWRGAALDTSALSALVKLSSIGIEADLTELPALAPQVTNSFESLDVITQALSVHKPLSFNYRNVDLSTSLRKIAPYATGSSHGFWYVAGLDIEKSALRMFRLDRIVGEVTLIEREEAFTVPMEFDVKTLLGTNSYSNEALLRLRKGKAHSLRESATLVSSDGEWDLVKIKYADEQQIIRQSLWYGSDLLIVEPLELRDRLITALQKMVEIHA